MNWVNLYVAYMMERVAVVALIFLIAVWCSACSTVQSRADASYKVYTAELEALKGKTRREAIDKLGVPTKVWKGSEEGTEIAEWTYERSLGTSYTTVYMPNPMGYGAVMQTVPQDNGTEWCRTQLKINILGFIENYRWKGNHCFTK